MSDDKRAALRRYLEGMLRIAACPDLTTEVIGSLPSANTWAMVSASCQVRESAARGGEAPDLPPLTAAQQLALSVLLGDPDTLPNALADFMLDLGSEYAQACYERGKREAFEKMERAAMKLEQIQIDRLSTRGRLLALPDGWTVNGPPVVGPPMSPSSVEDDRE